MINICSHVQIVNTQNMNQWSTVTTGSAELNTSVRSLEASVISIEDYIWVWIVNQRHNCDLKKYSDKSNQTIVNLFEKSRDLIDQYFLTSQL